MRKINTLISILVGALFIFSGLIKINDPIGTAIKLEEYFEVFSEDFTVLFHYFTPLSLAIAIFLCVLEVVLGVAIVAGFRKRNTIVALLLMIVFFTFLTFYSAYFNKVTDCGCFGDAIPLSPWQSFYKDLVLLLCISVLAFQLKSFHNHASKLSALLLGASVVFSIIIAYIGTNHLPIKDFRDYKKGNNIGKMMDPGIPCEFVYIMEKDGRRVELSQYPKDKSYQYKGQKVLNAQECQPKITDYYISDTLGNDLTNMSLSGKKIFIIIQKQAGISALQIKKLRVLKQFAATKSDTDLMLITSDSYRFATFGQKTKINLPYYLADATVLKAMIRSNPGIIYLEDGVVIDKWHINDLKIPLW